MGGRCYGDDDLIRHFRADPSEGLRGEHRYVEVRYDDGSDPAAGDQRTVDEICSTQVHLEGMSQDTVWMSICGLHVWICAVRVKGEREPHLRVTCFPSTATPYVVAPGSGTLETGRDCLPGSPQDSRPSAPRGASATPPPRGGMGG